MLKDRMVCECYDITVDKIKQALLDGAKGYDDLVKSMRLGVLCSACIGDAKKVVEQLQIEIEEEKNRGTVWKPYLCFYDKLLCHHLVYSTCNSS